MIRRAPSLVRRLAFAGGGFLIAAQGGGAESTPVSFKRAIAPILASQCVACHGPKQAKGKFRLDTFARLNQPGSSDEAPIVPGHPERSLIVSLIAAADEDDRMPQESDPLPAADIAMIRRWIVEGGTFDGDDPEASLAVLAAPESHPAPPERYRQSFPIAAIAFRPGTGELAVGGYHEVTVWNPTNGALLRRLTNVAERTQGLAFHPAGGLLAVAGGSPGRAGEVRLIDPETGALERLLERTRDVVMAVRFDAEGARVAAGGADQSLRVYETATGRRRLLIEQHADWVMDVAFAAEGRYLVTAGRDKAARFFDLESGTLEDSYLEHGEPVLCLAVRPDGRAVFSAGRDRSIHRWGLPKADKQSEFGRFERDVCRLLISGERLYAASADSSVREFKLEGSHELVRTFSGPKDAVLALDMNGAGDRLAAAGHAGRVYVWDAATGELLHEFLAIP